MTIVAVFNQKGGVGKTTTVLNLAAALARRGRQPIGIDLDPQAQFSAVTGTPPIPAMTVFTACFSAIAHCAS
jgi:chromosome partitioning protein